MSSAEKRLVAGGKDQKPSIPQYMTVEPLINRASDSGVECPPRGTVKVTCTAHCHWSLNRLLLFRRVTTIEPRTLHKEQTVKTPIISLDTVFSFIYTYAARNTVDWLMVPRPSRAA